MVEEEFGNLITRLRNEASIRHFESNPYTKKAGPTLYMCVHHGVVRKNHRCVIG